MRRRRRLRTPGGFGGVGGTAMMAGSATVAAMMLVVVHPRPGLESSPSRSPRPRHRRGRLVEGQVPEQDDVRPRAQAHLELVGIISRATNKHFLGRLEKMC